MSTRKVYNARLRSCSAVFVVVGIAGAAPAIGQTYVDAHATGPAHDGSSWCNAWLSLSEALATATSGDIILVANGLYVPDSTGLADPREATFELVDGVVLEGGYAGCGAADPDRRDLLAHPSILSGDLQGDDGLALVTRADNVRHVISARQDQTTFTVLDGFTIQGGNADEVCCESGANGGGVFIDQSAPTIQRCTIRDNHASRGGGMAVLNGASPLIRDCVFQHNQALYDLATGGAMFTSSSSPQIENCLFTNNRAGIGGAITRFAGAPLVSNCTIADNEADDEGAGVFSAQQSMPLTVVNTVLWDNVVSGGSQVGEDAQIAPSGAQYAINHSCVKGWTGLRGGTGNFGDDPLFTRGPLSCYYLSHTAAGFAADSPCVDAGDSLAVDLDLDSRTTRSDESGDAGTVDIGYHHPVSGGAFVAGDADGDSEVTLSDVAAFQNSFTGSDPLTDLPCAALDLDADRDLDLNDLTALIDRLLGPS